MSIKRKFATAVATASLLAGLFGSALVSTASAAGRIGGSGTVSASRSEIYEGSTYPDVTVDSSEDSSKWTGAKDFYMDLDDRATVGDDPVASNSQSIEYYFETAGGDEVTRVQQLKATSSSSVVDVRWMYDDDGDIADNCEDDDILPLDNWTTSDTVEGAEDNAGYAGGYELCLIPNKAGKATITVVADGVTLPAVTVTVFGDLETLTLAVRNGHNYIAADNAEVGSYFTLVGKDSAGQTLNAGGNGAFAGDGDLEAFDITEAAANPQFAGDTDSDFFDEDNYREYRGVNAYDAFEDFEVDDDFEFGFAINRYALEEGACGADDAGKTYAIAVEGVNADGDTVTSNTVSITCTGDEAKVTDLSVEATGGAKKYSESGTRDDLLSIWATVVDQAGRPMGVGVNVDFGISFDGDADLNDSMESDIDIEGARDDESVALGNKIEIGTIAPDVDLKAVYPYTVTLAESDLGADESVEYSEEFTYTVDASVVEKTYTISVVKNASKTRATMTVNFGAACSRKLVDFDVQLANGDVKYLTRRANINGVATLIMERRNTKIYVQAFCGGSALTGYDLESDLRGVRFR